MSCWILAAAEVSLSIGLVALAALVWDGHQQLRRMHDHFERTHNDEGPSS